MSQFFGGMAGAVIVHFQSYSMSYVFLWLFKVFLESFHVSSLSTRTQIDGIKHPRLMQPTGFYKSNQYSCLYKHSTLHRMSSPSRRQRRSYDEYAVIAEQISKEYSKYYVLVCSVYTSHSINTLLNTYSRTR